MKTPDNSQGGTPTIPASIAIKTKNGNLIIPVTDILYFEACGNYTDLITATVKHTVIERIGTFEKKLKKEWFMRVHKSRIINKFYIKKWHGSRVWIAHNEIPIGEKYLPEFRSYINTLL